MKDYTEFKALLYAYLTTSFAGFNFCCFNKVLWILPFEWLSWCTIVVALCLSGSVLVMTFWPAVRDDHPRVIIAFLSAVVLLNVLLAVGCKVTVAACDI